MNKKWKPLPEHEKKLKEAIAYLEMRNKYVLTSAFRPTPAGTRINFNQYK